MGAFALRSFVRLLASVFKKCKASPGLGSWYPLMSYQVSLLQCAHFAGYRQLAVLCSPALLSPCSVYIRMFALSTWLFLDMEIICKDQGRREGTVQ